MARTHGTHCRPSFDRASTGVFAEPPGVALVRCSGQTSVIQDESVRLGLTRGGRPDMMALGVWDLGDVGLEDFELEYNR